MGERKKGGGAGFELGTPSFKNKAFDADLQEEEEEVLVRPAGGAHSVVCVGPNTPV